MQAPSFGSSNSAFSNSSTDLTKYGNFGSSLKWSRKWNAKLYGNTILSYSNFYSDRNRSQEGTVIKSNGETTTNETGAAPHGPADRPRRRRSEWEGPPSPG